MHTHTCMHTHTHTAGHDIKSLALNFASSLLILLPFAVYFYPEYLKEEIGVVCITFVGAYLAPPRGMLRPHPFSDYPENAPFRFNKKQQ